MDYDHFDQILGTRVKLISRYVHICNATKYNFSINEKNYRACVSLSPSETLLFAIITLISAAFRIHIQR